MIKCTRCNKKADMMYRFCSISAMRPICYKCRRELLKIEIKCDTCGETIKKYNKIGIADFYYAVKQCNSCYYEENK